MPALPRKYTGETWYLYGDDSAVQQIKDLEYQHKEFRRVQGILSRGHFPIIRYDDWINRSTSDLHNWILPNTSVELKISPIPKGRRYRFFVAANLMTNNNEHGISEFNVINSFGSSSNTETIVRNNKGYLDLLNGYIATANERTNQLNEANTRIPQLEKQINDLLQGRGNYVPVNKVDLKGKEITPELFLESFGQLVSDKISSITKWSKKWMWSNEQIADMMFRYTGNEGIPITFSQEDNVRIRGYLGDGSNSVDDFGEMDPLFFFSVRGWLSQDEVRNLVNAKSDAILNPDYALPNPQLYTFPPELVNKEMADSRSLYYPHAIGGIALALQELSRVRTVKMIVRRWGDRGEKQDIGHFFTKTIEKISTHNIRDIYRKYIVPDLEISEEEFHKTMMAMYQELETIAGWVEERELIFCHSSCHSECHGSGRKRR